MNKNSLTIAACLAFTFCTLGCETTDYEPLRVKRKLKELEKGMQELRGENEALRQEVEQLKTGGTITAPPQSNAKPTAMAPPTTLDTPVPTSLTPTILTAAAEQEIRQRLESTNIFFVKDESGFTIEADLTECQPEDVNPTTNEIKDFTRLKRITYAGNNTDADTFNLLASMTTLDRLDLPNSKPSAASMAQLAALPKLTFLELRKATLDEASIEAISKSKSLKQIRCAQTRLGDAELQFLGQINSLEAIDLSDCNRVSSRGVEYLANCPRLKFLKVFGKAINDNTLNIVAGMKSLRVLGLNDSAVTDEGIAKLAELNLSEVSLFRTSIGDASIAVLAKMPNLSTVNLRDTRISDQSLASLADCSKLRRIDLSECNSPGITDVGCESLAKIPTLQEINLWKTKVGNSGIELLARLPNLKKLNLDDTEVGDRAVIAIGKMNNLNWLHLGKTNITDASADVLQKMTKLRFLDITFTNQMSEDASYDIADELEPLGCYVKM